MGNHKTWVDWAVLALCMAAALGAVFYGANTITATHWMRDSREHAAIGVLGIICGLTVVNCAFLVGAAVCKARRDLRLGRR
jgi:hypothetical protein